MRLPAAMERMSALATCLDGQNLGLGRGCLRLKCPRQPARNPSNQGSNSRLTEGVYPSFPRDPDLTKLDESDARRSAAARHAHGQVFAALDEKHAACLATLLAATHYRPAITAAARIGHAARKVIFAARSGAGGGVAETLAAGPRIPHAALRMIGATSVADDTRPLPNTLQRTRDRGFGGDKQGADCGDCDQGKPLTHGPLFGR